MNTMLKIATLVSLTLVACVSWSQTFYGPSAYLKLGDSPLQGLGTLVHEDFESGPTFDLVGVTMQGGEWTRLRFPTFVDSVDADDGVINGSGLDGNSWFAGDAPGAKLTFTFSAIILGALPQHVGIVATDGIATTTFRAFGPNGALLGQVTGNHYNPNASGDTAEDRFYGVSFAQGISKIEISAQSLEVDHVQMVTPVPEPATLLGFGIGVGLLKYGSRRRKALGA